MGEKDMPIRDATPTFTTDSQLLPSPGGAWQATVHGVEKNQTRLSN